MIYLETLAAKLIPVKVNCQSRTGNKTQNSRKPVHQRNNPVTYANFPCLHR